MGTYLNPTNAGFAGIVSNDYVDKTGLIALTNAAIDTQRRLIAITRPRRFGKSFAAESLVAYYSCGCDSSSLFEGLAISHSQRYKDFLNCYNVVKLDMTALGTGDDDAPTAVTRVLIEEVRELLPGAGARDAGYENELTSALLDVVRKTGRKFVFVIDEWDAPLREGCSGASKERWVRFLRTLFKNANFTPEAVALGYLTGILPIKRYGTQSALSDFREYTMLSPAAFAPYVGFTEDEVESLARKHGMDMAELKNWYDGYSLPGAPHIYAPFSVMEACTRGQVGSYWASSESFESLRLYVDMDFDGLQSSVVQLLGGAELPVRIGTFNNDMEEVASCDDVLTLLVHLGYLAYDPDAGRVRIPNQEVRSELRDAIGNSRHAGVAIVVRRSDELLSATWDMDAPTVASAIGRVHDEFTAPLYYNDEQALRAVIKAAYISCADNYARIEELPSGRGYADMAYIPKRGSSAPAMVVELKWDRPIRSAIDRIRDRNYPAVLKDLGVPILLVGISYDPKTKAHACAIEEIRL